VSTKATRFGRLSGHLETRFNINREDEWRAVPSWLARTVCVSLSVHVFKQAFNIIHLLRVLSRGLSSVRRHSPLPLALSLFLSLSRFPRSTNLGLSTAALHSACATSSLLPLCPLPLVLYSHSPPPSVCPSE